MNPVETEVSFYSNGMPIFGTLCATPLVERSPAVVLVHGFGSFRDELTGFVELAKRLAHAKIASLRIDMHGCGHSGVRGLMHPIWDWVEDLRQAVSFLQTVPMIAPDRIAVAGMSMGGGIACISSAVDERLRVVVALAPVVDGQEWFRHLWITNRGEEAWQEFQQRIILDRRSQSVTKRSASISMLDALAFGSADRRAYLRIVEKHPSFLRRIRLSAVDSALRVRAAPFASLIAPRPLLIIHSRADASVPVQQAEALSTAAREPNRLIIIDDSPHCFWIGDQSQFVQEATVAWLREYL